MYLRCTHHASGGLRLASTLSSRALPAVNGEVSWQMGRGLIGGIDVAHFLRQDHMKQLDGLRPAFFSPIIPETHVLSTLNQVLHDPFPEVVGECHPIDLRLSIALKKRLGVWVPDKDEIALFGCEHDLVNPLEDGSHLLPLLVRHPRQAGLPTDPGVDDHGPIREHGPQSTAAGRNGSHDGCNSLIVEIARNQTSWFVERSRRDFEQIGSSLLAHRTIHPGVVIMSQGKKRQRDGAQIILVLQTGSKVFLCNPRWLTHSSARPILSFLSVFFIHSKEYVFTL